MRRQVLVANCLAMLFLLVLGVVLGWLMVTAAEMSGWWMSPIAQREAQTR